MVGDSIFPSIHPKTHEYARVGHWLRAVDSKYPSQNPTYLGTDINTTFFPTFYGSNYDYYKHNMGEAWPEKDHGTFDLVYQRLSLPGAAPTPLLQAVTNLFALVKPGGWIQLVEAEQVVPNSECGPVFCQFLDLVRAVFDATGAGWNCR
jgi:hypothetical protein